MISADVQQHLHVHKMSIVTDHVLELLEPIDERLKVKPRLDISDREYQLFCVIMGIILPSLLLL